MRLPKRHEDYSLRVTVVGENNVSFESLPCKVYLPKLPTDRPVLFIRPPRADKIRVGMYNAFWRFSVSGEESDGKTKYAVISSDVTYLAEVGADPWSEDSRDSIWKAEPADLKVHQPFDSGDFETTNCKFFVTPSFVLTPKTIIKRSPDGNVEIQAMRDKRFTLSNNLELDFKSHYKEVETKKNGKVTSGFLVGESNVWNLPNGSQKIDVPLLKEIDTFLLVAGLAGRHRCICSGWEAYDSTGHNVFYRGDVSIPKVKNSSRRDDLISLNKQETFIRQVYPLLAGEENAELLERVIYALIVKTSTIDDRYLRLFSALETLVLTYRNKYNLRFLFANEDERIEWKGILKREFKEWLREFSLFSGDENASRRSLLYKNLSALERISFADAFERFCEHYEADLSDLWPVAGGAGGRWSLTVIRNKLAHGEVLGGHKTNALGAATMHLQWTVERLLLMYFGWELANTDVSPQALSEQPDYRDWENYRNQISDSTSK